MAEASAANVGMGGSWDGAVGFRVWRVSGAARDGWITHDRSYVRYEHYVRVMGVTSGSHPRPLAQLRPRRMGRLASAGDELRTDHR